MRKLAGNTRKSSRGTEGKAREHEETPKQKHSLLQKTDVVYNIASKARSYGENV